MAAFQAPEVLWRTATGERVEVQWGDVGLHFNLEVYRGRERAWRVGGSRKVPREIFFAARSKAERAMLDPVLRTQAVAAMDHNCYRSQIYHYLRMSRQHLTDGNVYTIIESVLGELKLRLEVREMIAEFLLREQRQAALRTKAAVGKYRKTRAEGQRQLTLPFNQSS